MMEAWRPPRFTTEQRLAVADRVLGRLRARYAAGLLAVALEGSTAKGLDRAESDLELRAVLAGGEEHRWYAFLHRGMFVGVSVVTVERARRDAAEVDYTWPCVGDALFTARVLHDPAGLYAELRALGQAAEERADFMALARDSLADMYEHVYKLFTAGDDGGTAAHEARQVAFWAANTVGLVNRFRYLSSRTLFAESARLPALPEGYGHHVEGLLALCATPGELQSHTGALWAAFASWAADRGSRLEDDAMEGV